MTPLQTAAQKALHQMAMENWNWSSCASTDEKRSAYVELQKALEAEQSQAVEPMFWVRLCSDGGYEGPIHNAGIERVRKLSGAWAPLYLHPAPTTRPTTPSEKSELIAAGVTGECVRVLAFNDRPAPPPVSFQDELVMLTAIALYEFQEATGCDTAAQFKAQQVAVPMTNEQIMQARDGVSGTRYGYVPFARAIEAHHGIGVKP